MLGGTKSQSYDNFHPVLLVYFKYKVEGETRMHKFNIHGSIMSAFFCKTIMLTFCNMQPDKSPGF